MRVEEKAICFEVDGVRYYSPRVEIGSDGDALTVTAVEPILPII